MEKNVENRIMAINKYLESFDESSGLYSIVFALLFIRKMIVAK